jgi:hypothetical protein
VKQRVTVHGVIIGATDTDMIKAMDIPKTSTEIVAMGIFDAIAVVTEDAERDKLWTQGVALYPSLAEHQAKTTRQIPVIALSRQES